MKRLLRLDGHNLLAYSFLILTVGFGKQMLNTPVFGVPALLVSFLFPFMDYRLVRDRNWKATTAYGVSVGIAVLAMFLGILYGKTYYALIAVPVVLLSLLSFRSATHTFGVIDEADRLH